MSSEAVRHRFTVEQYDRMGETGIFHEDDRVELIRGEIIEMTPIGSLHAGRANRFNRAFTSRLGPRAVVAVQNPLRLAPDSEPQPDILLLHPRDDFYESRHPTAQEVYLLVEISDSSLGYDRAVKLPLYAESGIPEVWIVDVQGRAIDVHTSPGPRGFAEVRRLTHGDVVSPLAFPDCCLAVGELVG